jgi:membrane dipeptidase
MAAAPDPEAVHREAIVIDATCPLANREESIDEWIRGGATAIAPSLNAADGIDGAIRSIGRWLARIAAHPDKFIHVTRAADITAAKDQGRLGIIFHFQDTDPVVDNLELLAVYARLGVRMVQLTYNRKNRVGDGCEERTDAGLSRFGVRLIQEMNRLGLIVDLSHTGYAPPWTRWKRRASPRCSATPTAGRCAIPCATFATTRSARSPRAAARSASWDTRRSSRQSRGRRSST